MYLFPFMFTYNSLSKKCFNQLQILIIYILPPRWIVVTQSQINNWGHLGKMIIRQVSLRSVFLNVLCNHITGSWKPLWSCKYLLIPNNILISLQFIMNYVFVGISHQKWLMTKDIIIYWTLIMMLPATSWLFSVIYLLVLLPTSSFWFINNNKVGF